MEKPLLLLSFIFIGLFVKAQKPATTVNKAIDENQYLFNEIPVKIENGEGEKLTVLFSGKVSKYVWDSLVFISKNEKAAFENLAEWISLKAKYSLKNTLSFEPLKKQFFSTDKSTFVCNYKMRGRNGYGNLVESNILIMYNPFVKESSENKRYTNDDTTNGKIVVPNFNKIFKKGED